MTIQNRELNRRLGYIESCAEHAPERTYESAKLAASTIAECGESIMRIFKANGFRAIGMDGLRDIEAAIYGYLLDCNPSCYGLITGEGFGEAMDGPEELRERVIAQAIRDRDSFEAALNYKAENDTTAHDWIQDMVYDHEVAHGGHGA